jgi:site-specific DNA recombinase
MEAVGYIRVSSAGQVADGVSLDAQKDKIRAWATINDAELVQIFADEGISGCRSDRPGLLQAVDYAQQNKAALIVYSLSRLSRSTRDTLDMAERLDKAGADLVSLSEKIDTTTAAGKMVFRMLAVLNEFERDQVSDRTKAALAWKKSQGEKTGGLVPFGYDVEEGKLTDNPQEQRIIQRIIEFRQQGMNYSQIARRLNELGHRTKTGKNWFPQTVKNVILQDAA